MISKEVLLERMNSNAIPTHDLFIKVDGAQYQVHSKQEEALVLIKENISKIIPECCQLFYLSDTTYCLPTGRYALRFFLR